MKNHLPRPQQSNKVLHRFKLKLKPRFIQNWAINESSSNSKGLLYDDLFYYFNIRFLSFFLSHRSNEETQSQSSPISFSIMDAPGRLNYTGSNASGKRPPHFQHNYRHYQPQQAQSTNAEDFQRPKSGPEYQTDRKSVV